MIVLSNNRRSGIALVIVMICIAVLSILAAGFAFSMKVETKLAQNSNSENELLWMGLSGVEYARWVLVQQTAIPEERGFDALNQFWASGDSSSVSNSPFDGMTLKGLPLGNGSFSVTIIDLERKANVNTARLDLLQRGFDLVGVDAAESSQICSAIIDWIDEGDELSLNGAEDRYYQSLDPPYHCKNKPVDDLSELLFVRGVTPDMYWGGLATNHPPSSFQAKFGPRGPEMQTFPVGLVSLFTPFSSGQININTASREVLQMIPFMDENIVAEVERLRTEAPFRNINQLAAAGLNPQLFQQIAPYITVQSRTFEVTVDAEVAGYHRIYTAVVGRPANNPRGIQVLTFSWK